MKKTLFYIAGLFLLFSACTHVRTLSTGLENEAFIEFIYTNPKQDYKEGVTVTIDDKAPFTAVVNKDKAKSSKGNIYAISTGTHTIVVIFKGEVLYKKQIFVSSQQTVKIRLQ